MMCKLKKSKMLIGVLLAFALIIVSVISPLQNAIAVEADGVAVTRGASYDLPETIEDYLSSGKTLEFDLNFLISDTDVCRLRLYNGSTQVSSDFILRNGESGLSMTVEPIEGGWYHYIISLATVPHSTSHEGKAVTRIRASSTFPTGTKINNISIGEDLRSLPETFTEDYDTVTLADLDLIGNDFETPVLSGSYEYNGKSATNSVIIKFGWEANISNNGSIVHHLELGYFCFGSEG